jgi:hypothetical protein
VCEASNTENWRFQRRRMISRDRDRAARRTGDEVKARPRICRLVLRSWELGGRRDRQGPEEGKFGRVLIQVEWTWIIGMSTIDHRQLFPD